LQVERIDLVDERRQVGHDFQVDRWRGGGLAEFSPQIFTGGRAERAQVVSEIRIAKLQFRHRHTGRAGKPTGRKITKRVPVFRREILERHE